MSVAQPQAAAPNVKEAAYAQVLHTVHIPVVLNRLAARGYIAKTAEEQQQLLELSTKLAMAAEAGQVPAAQPKTSKFAAASEALDHVLSNSAVTHEQQLKQATQQLLQDESIYAATVALIND
jgi:hypothetical protein